MGFSNSSSFFNSSSEEWPVETNRLVCLKDFLKKCALLPVALLYKGYKTCCRVLVVLLALALLGLTLGASSSVREFFIDRFSLLAKDIADWILLPFAFFVLTLRFVMALLIHPNIYTETT